jgi:diacylglycerol kinase family enzyme
VRACATGLAGGEVPLAIVPLGTGNLVAINFDIPIDDLDDALEIAIQCRRRRIDLGAHREERFVVAAGIGFDAAMLRDADKRLKRRLGPLAYVVSALRHLRRPNDSFRIRLDGGQPVEHRAQDVLIGNLGKIQGGLPLLPDAVPDDGLLDIAVTRARNLGDWLLIALRVLLRNPRRPGLVETFRASTVEVSCGRPQPVQFDGEDLESTRGLSVQVAPFELTLAVPAHQVEQTAPVRRHS